MSAQRTETAVVKERPMLFSAPMVRAILDGRKTVTRRIAKLPHAANDGALACPHGIPGGRLWGRETWRVASESNHYPTDEKRLYVEYRAGAVAGVGQHQSLFSIERDADLARRAWQRESHQWRPSIFMPRWASRITLDVVNVSIERLHDVTEEDARAEGVRFDGQWWDGGTHKIKGTPKALPTAREAFADLWSDINGAESWAANPWVWRVEFRRLTQEGARHV